MLQRLLLPAGAALIVLAACRNQPGAGSAAAGQPDSAARQRAYELAEFDYGRLEGLYGGDFGGAGDLRIAIRHAGGRHAVGYSLFRGLRRNLSGSLLPAGDGFDFRLAEPGDNPYDGVFDFHIDTGRFALRGRWTAAAAGGPAAKTFVLRRLAVDTTQAGNREWTYGDSIGNLTLHADGLCTYDYYQHRDGREVGQQQFVNGNWRQEGGQLRIDWQPNSVFPSRKSVFQLLQEDGTSGTAPLTLSSGYLIYLKGGGRELHSNEI